MKQIFKGSDLYKLIWDNHDADYVTRVPQKQLDTIPESMRALFSGESVYKMVRVAHGYELEINGVCIASDWNGKSNNCIKVLMDRIEAALENGQEVFVR